MTTISGTDIEQGTTGDAGLRRAGIAWFVVAAAGQVAFVCMIVVHYGYNTVIGKIAGWNDKPLIKGYVPGDTAGNVMFGIHVLLAAVITLGGLAQIVPAIRTRAPLFHRWNGRLFVLLAIAMALGGLWLTGVRQTYLSPVSGISVAANGVLILAFTAVAWRLAIRQRFAAHRRWALRTFMVVSGVWFLRIGIMAWVIVTAGGFGMNRTMSGPADVVLQFGSYLVPLAMLEAYFHAQRTRHIATKRVVAGAIVAMTTVTALGVYGTVAFMWLPYMP